MKLEHYIRPGQFWTDAILLGSVLLMIISLVFTLWQAL